MFGYSLSEVRKFVIGTVGFAASLVATILAVGPDLIPDAALPYVNAFIAVVASYGIFKAKNTPAPGQPSDPAVSEIG